MGQRNNSNWLVLVHQLPTSPAYLRVKVARRLQAIGAMPLKNSVYALPSNESTLEDFHRVRREILDGKGEATILECSFVEGLTHAEAVAAFNRPRSEAYANIAREANQLRGRVGADDASRLEQEFARISKRMAEITATDYLGAPGRDSAQDRLDDLVASLTRPVTAGPEARQALDPADYRGRTWVTRTGVFVDRIASAWLIRRFIDTDARFRFVASRNPQLEEGQLGFDMFEADFTHEGDLCTFEVLLKRFGLRDKPLRRIAELIHDLDVKDDKYARPEVSGVQAVFLGIAARHKSDEDRLKAGFEFLDSLQHGLQHGMKGKR